MEKAGDLVIAKRQKQNQGMHWSLCGSEAVSTVRTMWLGDEREERWHPSQQAAWREPVRRSTAWMRPP